MSATGDKLLATWSIGVQTAIGYDIGVPLHGAWPSRAACRGEGLTCIEAQIEALSYMIR
jgi:hypothetical protein